MMTAGSKTELLGDIERPIPRQRANRQSIFGGRSEVHNVGALACLSAEPLAEEFCDIRLVIDHQDAYAHALILAEFL